MSDLKFGDVSVTRIDEMHGPVMATGDFFPTIPASVWEQERDHLEPDHLDGDMVRGAFQTWLLRSAGRAILVDTGIGNDKHRPAVPAWDHLNTGYLDRLAGAGVLPEDVDLVVNTHLHVDHIGWNTRLTGGDWVPTFPNATYLMPEADFHHFKDVTSGVNEFAYDDSIAPVQAAGQVRLWSGSYRIDENLTLEAAPGHTPGSSVIKLVSGSDRALFAGDLVHTPLQLGHPGHSSCFCEDAAEAEASRVRLLGWAAQNAALVLPAHFSMPGAFEVSAGGGSFAVKRWA
ncbi:MBL fold metallo-hydrolase [Actinoplanes sp. TFC3]|uniref:MBL fold metallo-hydrolase n=1 Tax=Actinoplanes sp. TFC3 TaxID=1710355 RepID=UPI00083285FD|nr:MBL fold metallo-hydrolase [Actinoplanes sp. TFC3]